MNRCNRRGADRKLPRGFGLRRQAKRAVVSPTSKWAGRNRAIPKRCRGQHTPRRRRVRRTAGLFLIGFFAIAYHASAIVPWSLLINTNNVVNALNYGAVGDGVTTNTTAIQNAISAAAAGGVTNGLSGGTVEIPGPGVYLCGPLTMQSAVDLQIGAGAILRMLPYDKYPGGIVSPPNFISASSLHDIEISGAGAIDGQGAPWWPGYKTNNRPIMIRFQGCTRQLIQGVTLSNSPMFHISLSSSKGNATVQGVTILAPPSSGVSNPSHNTDACDVSGTNVLVQNCYISVGDDDFTCGGNTHDVLLTNNTYGNGHGISIGSYTAGGVSNITVINCTINGADNGLRIKSDNDRGGLVQNIAYLNIGMTNVHFPIQIYAYYNEVGTPSSISPYYAATQQLAAVTGTTPIYRDILYSNITATSVSGYPIGIIWARTEMPATNIVFKRVNLTGDRSFDLYNVSGAQFVDCTLKPSSSTTTFALFNAQVVITNQAPTNALFTFDGLTTNGYGNALAFYNASGSLKNTNCFDHGPLTLAAGPFTVSNSLALFPSTTLNFTLGTNAATLAVVGNLVLGGVINIAAGGGFTNGTYTLMIYSGTLSGSLPTLGLTPAGYHYFFDTNTAGQVKLVVASTALSPPPTPTNLMATAGNASVTLAWSPSATATSYNVKRSAVSGGAYTTLAGVTTTNYTDTQVTNGATYYYVVSAVNAAGESADSAEVSATPRAPTFVTVTTNVFNDVFSGSTVDSAAPAAPTATSTDYEIASTKNATAPTISAGHLTFGLPATTSGFVEAQALFSSTPVALSVGDYLELTVMFTDTAGILSSSASASSSLNIGLYNSGGVAPLAGGVLLNSGLSAATTYSTGGAQLWQGYVGRILQSGNNSIFTRPLQNGGTANDNNGNQDLVFNGAGTGTYKNPTGVQVGSSVSATTSLTAGSTYTLDYVLTLTGANTLAISNNLYAGAGVNAGNLLFSQTVVDANALTNAFDGLALGWRFAASSGAASSIDVNHIAINATRTVAVTNQMSLAPTNLQWQATGDALEVSWPADHLGWRLQIQTNDLSGGLGTNWADVPDSTNTTQFTLPMNPTNGSVFLRLVYP